MMTDEFSTRALMVYNRHAAVYGEAQQAQLEGDSERVLALYREAGVLLSSLYEIRHEQLMAQLAPPSEPRRWWQFWRGRDPDG